MGASCIVHTGFGREQRGFRETGGFFFFFKQGRHGSFISDKNCGSKTSYTNGYDLHEFLLS